MVIKRRHQARHRAARGAQQAPLPVSAAPRGWALRGLLWTMGSPARAALTIGALLTLGVGIGHALPTAPGGWPALVTWLLAVLIFGVFVGVIVVTETDRDCRGPRGTRLRVLTGAMSLTAMALALGGSFELAALGALVGAMLGYVGVHWLRHV